MVWLLLRALIRNVVIRQKNKFATKIIVAFVSASLFSVHPTHGMDPLDTGDIATIALALYKKRLATTALETRARLRHHDLVVEKQTMEQSPNPEIYLDTAQIPPVLSISCLYLSAKDLDQAALEPLSFEFSRYSLAEWLVAKIPALILTAPSLSEKKYPLWPSLLKEHAALQWATKKHRYLTAKHPYLWPEQCPASSYHRYLADASPLEIKQISPDTVGLVQPIIRQWPQESPTSPIRTCFELLCMSQPQIPPATECAKRP